MHGNLIIGIYEAQQLVPYNKIQKLVYPWKRKAILWTYLIEVGKVYADLSLAFVLLFKT